MKKTNLTLLALTSILALGGCTATARVASADNEVEPVVEKVTPTSIRLDKGSAAIYVGETFQLKARVKPLFAYDAEIEYVSANPEIATVDENGLITGVAEGETTVTVSAKADSNVKQVVPVYIAKEAKGAAFTQSINAMKAIQESSCSRPSKIYSMMDYNYYLEVDGKLKESTLFHRDIIASEPDGYFSMATTGQSTNTFDGITEYINYRYQILTSGENYRSFLFYEGDFSKNVLFVNTAFAADEEGITPYEVCNRILDGLFSTARDIGENVFKYSLNTRYLKATNFLGGNVGTIGNTVLIGNSVEDGNFTIGNDQESSFEIPAGTKFDAHDVDSFVWKNGYCKRYGILYDWTYTLDDGKLYHNVTDLVYTLYLNEEVTVELPNVSDYHVVEHLYDL